MKRIFRISGALLLALSPTALLAQKGRPVVAIYAMDDLAQTGKAAQFSQMIETAIESTNKFRVIEREHMGKLLGEQARAKAGLVTTNRPGKIGGFEGADFLIYGTITSVSVTNKADFGSTFLAGVIAGQNNAHPTCSNAYATLGIDIKITDGNSGEVKQVTRINEQQKSAAVCGSNGQIDVAPADAQRRRQDRHQPRHHHLPHPDRRCAGRWIDDAQLWRGRDPAGGDHDGLPEGPKDHRSGDRRNHRQQRNPARLSPRDRRAGPDFQGAAGIRFHLAAASWIDRPHRYGRRPRSAQATVQAKEALSMMRIAVLIAALVVAAPAAAQQRIAIRLGTVTSTQSCTLYQQSAGRSALVTGPGYLAAASSWRTWLVKDCVDNFASLRASLESALAASGRIVVAPGAATYTLVARISEAGGGGPAPYAPDMGPGGYSLASSNMAVAIDVSLRDKAGRAVFGALLTKRIETGSNIVIDGFRSSSTNNGQQVYAELQHLVAFAVARQIAFKLAPPHIIGGDGREIRIDCGAPLIGLGTVLQVTSADGSATINYNVTAAGSGASTAEIDGDGDVSRIMSGGASVVVIEPEDPAANRRRFKRVELPL